MNFNKFVNSDYLKSNPLCGINTYKDELNLATGACTRKIKKVVLTGEENWWVYTGKVSTFAIATAMSRDNAGICSHYTPVIATEFDVNTGFYVRNSALLIISDTRFTDMSDFKTYLQQQYTNGTPVVVYYILSTATTETITVPSGLSGTEEGYLNRSGTPTPTNPIYPTANTVEKWFGINHYIHNTSTDTLTTLPADIYANDTTATVGLKGQMEQSGTPTPTAPIQPSECGERTGNLFDDFDIVGQVPSVNNGNLVNSALGGTTSFIKMGSAEIILSYNAIASIYLFLYDNDSQFIGYIQKTNGEPIYSTSISGYSNAVYCRVRVDNLADLSNANLMLNLGSTPQPYEPYGYKIPILNNSQTTNVYLSEVESTRRIKKLVLTGEENWTLRAEFTSATAYSLYHSNDKAVPYSSASLVCSHFEFLASYASETNHIYQDETSFYVTSTDYLTLSDFTTFLQQQYANGTPVCVWYVLATPTTGIVNEPLRKIGDYADEVSGISIPTIAGANTISIGTTLEPSEVTATYKGWHPVADVHERENGAWT